MNTYAVVRLDGASGHSYTIGRVIEIDGATYVRFQPHYAEPDRGYAYELFGNKVDAFAAARALGNTLPDIQTRDFTKPHIEAVKPRIEQPKPRRVATPQVPAMTGMAPLGVVTKPDPTFCR